MTSTKHHFDTPTPGQRTRLEMTDGSQWVELNGWGSSPHMVRFFSYFFPPVLPIHYLLSAYGRQRMSSTNITKTRSANGTRDADASRAPTWYVYFKLLFFPVLQIDCLLSDYR
jgi:hypothetical protein